MTSRSNIPTDIATLQALLAAADARLKAQSRTILDRDAIIERKDDRIIRLEKLLADFKRALYGAKSEKGHPDQYHLALEDIEAAMAVVHAEDEAIDPPKTAASKSRAGRGVLPKHLPRVEELIAPEDVTCGCGAERHVIGEDVSERLDIVPAQFRVLVTRRPKYACRSCEAGIVQATANAPIQLAYCWAHARRKLFDLTHHNVAPIAEEGLKQIAALYRIEKQARATSAADRLALRQVKSAPKIVAFKTWLDHVLTQVSAKSPTGAALKYIAKYWDGLILFLTDGRIEMDSNAVERTIRPIALQRKNALFAGHDAGAQNWAMFASLIETCKINKVEPHSYLTGVLTAIVNGHKQKDIDQLLPWNYAA